MWPLLVTLLLVGVVLALVLADRSKKRTRRRGDRRDEGAREPRGAREGRPAQKPRAAKGGGGDFVLAIAALAREPTAENYLKLCAFVTAQPSYEPYGDDLDVLLRAYDAGRYDEAQRRIAEMMPTWVLTPTVHMVAGMIAKRHGDTRSAAIELRLADACIEGLLATGDGTKDAPYVVVRVKDEYDLIRHLKKERTEQGLLREGERSLDHLRFKDGSEIYFDITMPTSHLDRAMGASKSEVAGLIQAVVPGARLKEATPAPASRGGGERERPLIATAEAARRLARAIASDVLMHHKGKITAGMEKDDLFTALAEPIEEGRALHKSRVSPELYQESVYEQALADMLVHFRPKT